MSTTLTIEATSRQDMGKGASRRLRRLDDLIPAIVYGAGQEPTPLSIKHNEILKSLKNESFYSQILTLNVDGKSEQVILKDMQRHAYKPKVLHMDFLRIKADTKLTTKAAIHFINEKDAPGVQQGGVVSHLITDVEISCLPKDLPEFIEVDLANLELNATLHLSDIVLAEGISLVELMHDNNQAVASIHMPREQSVEEEAPEATEGDAEAPKDEAADES